MQVDFIGVNEGKQKRINSSKKMEFKDEDATFVFQARNPKTRNSKRLKELNAEVEKTNEETIVPEEIIDISSPVAEHAENRVSIAQEEMTKYKILDERLRSANHEITKLNKIDRKHVIEKIKFKRMKVVWEGQIASKLKIPSSVEQFFTWTSPNH